MKKFYIASYEFEVQLEIFFRHCENQILKCIIFVIQSIKIVLLKQFIETLNNFPDS